ncbi:MAG: cysteine--tRNA ligase [Gemmatimonadetes bacterium]|nr:MAG: cysteine--tRNA ligase [Gemmatimonadota bacterium]
MYIYNNLSNRKERFIPCEDNQVKMYVCGMTVQDKPHIGHMKSFLTADVMRRYLEYRGYRVKLVQNFTDVDDKIINRANQEGVPYLTVANRYIEEYYQVSDRLNIRRADIYPRATEHIPDIIALIQRLIDKGVAYEAAGDVYFAVEKHPDYGKLSNRSIADMIEGTRKDVQSNKKHPLDFALWKAAKPDEPHWDSPWGKGRPGWHIECSAMAMKYLGETFDIHGGGLDLIFPHHENERAQSEAATGKPFAHFWCEGGLLEIENTATKKVEKMSKSLNNFFAMSDILEKFEPDAVRMFLISGHYRSPLNFSEARMAEAKARLDRLRETFRNMSFILKDFDDDATLDVESSEPEVKELYEKAKAVREKFEAAMDDDFNTAQAMAVLFDVAKAANTFMASRQERFSSTDKRVLDYSRGILQDFLHVLGFSDAIFAEDTRATDITDDLIQILIEVRKTARMEKQWAIADTIRNRLEALGIALEDRPGGETRWKWK